MRQLGPGEACSQELAGSASQYLDRRRRLRDVDGGLLSAQITAQGEVTRDDQSGWIDRARLHAHCCIAALPPVDEAAELHFDRIMARFYAKESCAPITRRHGDR